jgi:prolyl 4-hydroxylase
MSNTERMMSTRHPLLDQAVAMARAGRKAECLALTERAAAAGDAEGLLWLAEVYWNGGPRPQDFARGRELYRRASEAGHPVARASYTNMLASGAAGSRDWSLALRRLAEETGENPKRAQARALVEQMELTGEGDPQTAPAGEVLSSTPQVTLFRAALTAAECAHLMQCPEREFRPARVSDGKGGERLNPVRTSEEATIHPLIEDPAVHAINRRLAALSGTKADQGEPLQLLRYRPGQEYRPHVDWLEGGNRRVQTALIYLNEEYSGGETLFVKTGLKVKGRTGDVLVFRNHGPDNRAEPLSEHAGLPVRDGVKFLASRWICERRYLP